jgi:probable F420-dependent oxidoreductase
VHLLRTAIARAYTPPVRQLSVGVQLPEVERDVRWSEIVSMARAAEASGFDSIWIGDHLLYRGDGRPERGPWDAWTTLAAIAASTERVRLGPLVACAAFHPPGILARMAASVDEVSRGRFVLGIGAGWNETEFRAFGIPFGERASRFEEAFAIVRRLLAGERVTFEGRFAHVADAVLLPMPDRRVPMMIGSNGDRLLRAALPYVDAWNTWYSGYGNTAEGFATLNDRVNRLAGEVGRPAGEVARSACALVVLDPNAGERPIDEGLVPLEGSPDRIADGLRGLSEAGADEVILVLSPITEGSIRSMGDVLSLLD